MLLTSPRNNTNNTNNNNATVLLVKKMQFEKLTKITLWAYLINLRGVMFTRRSIPKSSKNYSQIIQKSSRIRSPNHPTIIPKSLLCCSSRNYFCEVRKYEGINGSIKINGKTNDYADISDMNGFTAYGNYKGEKWSFLTYKGHTSAGNIFFDDFYFCCFCVLIFNF